MWPRHGMVRYRPQMGAKCLTLAQNAVWNTKAPKANPMRTITRIVSAGHACSGGPIDHEPGGRPIGAPIATAQ